MFIKDYFLGSNKIHDMEEYNKRRDELSKEAAAIRYGGLTFNDQETKANEIFIKATEGLKKKLDDKFYSRPILARDTVEPSSFYKLIIAMPKGVHQHNHNPCQVPSDWFKDHAYSLNAWADLKTKTVEIFENVEPKEGFQNLNKLKEEATDKGAFDRVVLDLFHITPEELYSEKMWTIFEERIGNRFKIAMYPGMWEVFTAYTFEHAIEEGFNCIQQRLLLPFGEEKDFMDPEEEIARTRRCVEKARAKNPNFHTAIVLSGLRFWDNKKIEEYMGIGYELRKKHKDLVIGFDLVGEEVTRNAVEFAPVFIEHLKKEEKEGLDFPLMLHAGESMFSTNSNLVDSLLLKTKRIGHGFNLFKHAYLIPKFKEQGVAVEVNPISNQVLKYCADLRIHPAIGYHSAGMKITISSDDAGILNHHTAWDYLICAVSFEFNLFDMKRVIINSIETSCMEKEIQDKLYKDWESNWEKFIDSILAGKFDQE